MGNIGWIIILLIAGIIVFLMENHRSHTALTLNRFTIPSEKIPKAFHNTKNAFLSDLHNRIMYLSAAICSFLRWEINMILL